MWSQWQNSETSLIVSTRNGEICDRTDSSRDLIHGHINSGIIFRDLEVGEFTVKGMSIYGRGANNYNLLVG